MCVVILREPGPLLIGKGIRNTHWSRQEKTVRKVSLVLLGLKRQEIFLKSEEGMRALNASLTKEH